MNRSPRSRPGSELLPGDPAALGPYELVGRIGEGSYGVVFEGRDADGQPAAVKLLKSARVPAQERRRFEREVAALQTVDSPRVARYLAHGSDSTGVWVAVEFVDGETLWDTVIPPGPRGHFTVQGYQIRTRPITGQELLEILWQALVGLRDLHGSGVTHRDLHPGNIMIRAWDYTIGPRDRPDTVLLDLGLSLQADEGLTRAGEAIGHWQFTPPEQRGAVPSGWNPAADVYSWAATAAFAAQGYPPHALSRVLEAPRRSADPNLAGVPGDLATVLASCLMEDPASRTSSDQVLRQLRALKAEWAHRDDEGRVDTRVLAAGFDEPAGNGQVRAHIDLEATYLARSTWARVPLVGRGSELVAVSPRSTVTLSASRYGLPGNQDGNLTGRLSWVTLSALHLADGARETPPLVCPSCGSPFQRRDPSVQPGLFCENRLRCPQQIRHRCLHLRKPRTLMTRGAKMFIGSGSRDDVMPLPQFLFRLVSLGLIDSEAEVFRCKLDARQDAADDSLEEAGLTPELLEKAERRRDDFLNGPPATTLAGLIGTRIERAEDLIGELGDIRWVAEVGRRQLAFDEFMPPWPKDRQDRETDQEAWFRSHLLREEADLLDHWREPVLDAWEAAGVQF